MRGVDLYHAFFNAQNYIYGGEKMRKTLVSLFVTAALFMLPVSVSFAENDTLRNELSSAKYLEDGTATQNTYDESETNLFYAAAAADYVNTITKNGIQYGLYKGEYDANLADVIGYTQEISADLVIPDTIRSNDTDYKVKEIADNAFLTCSIPVKITISNGIEAIGNYAFSGCSKCEEFVIPQSVSSIGYCTFSDMPALQNFNVNSSNTVYSSPEGVLIGGGELIQYPVAKTDREYSIPNEVTSIADKAFAGAQYIETVTFSDSVAEIGFKAFDRAKKLKNIYFGQGLKEIHSSCFYNCESLKNLYITKNVSRIVNNITIGCPNLESITVDSENKHFTVIDDALYDIDNKTVIAYPPASSRERVEISNIAETIGNAAFEHAVNLKEIIFPQSVKTIEYGAFTGCKFEEFTLGTGVTEIKNFAYQNCTSLKTINLNEGLQNIGSNCFYACSSLENINIPSSVASMGTGIFTNCSSLKNITVNNENTNYASVNGVLYSKEGALLSYPLGKTDEEFAVPNNVTTIDGGAFVGSKYLKSFSVDAGNEFFAAQDGVLFSKDMKVLYAYPRNKANTEYTVPQGVEKIGNQAFAKAAKDRYEKVNLSKIIMPDSLKEIGESAFMYCANLSEIELGNLDNLETIAREAFFSCYGINKLTIPKNIKYINVQAFDYCTNLEYIVFLADTPPEFEYMLCYNDAALKYIYVPYGTLNEYKAKFTASDIAPEAMIVEGNKIPFEDVKNTIDKVNEGSTKAEINQAAEEYVRLTKSENGQITDEDINKLESLFTKANTGLSVNLNNEIPELSASGCALAGGITEGDVTVNINKEKCSDSEIIKFSADLLINDISKQPRSPIIYSIKIPDEFINKRLAVTHMDKTGSTENILYERKENTLTFRSDKLNTYTVSFCEYDSSIEINNNDIIINSEKDAVLLAVKYSESGTVENMQTRSVHTGENVFQKSEFAKGDNIKLYLWSSLNSMIPLCEAKNISIN